MKLKLMIATLLLPLFLFAQTDVATVIKAGEVWYYRKTASALPFP